MRIDPTPTGSADSPAVAEIRTALARTVSADDWPAATWWATELWSLVPDDESARASVAFAYPRLHAHVVSSFEHAKRALAALNERLDARRSRDLDADEIEDTARRMLRAHLLDLLVDVAGRLGPWYDASFEDKGAAPLAQDRAVDLQIAAAVLAGDELIGGEHPSDWISTLTPENTERVFRRRECVEETLRTLIGVRHEDAWASTVASLATRWERDFPEDLEMAELLAGMQAGTDGIEDFPTRRDAYALQFARMGGQLLFAERMSRKPV